MNKIKQLKNSSFIRYLIVGGSAFVIEYSFYQLLYRFFSLDYAISSVIVYSVMFWLVFFMNRQWSFQSNGNIYKQIFKYLLLFFFNNIVGNVLLMRFLVETVNLSPDIAPVFKMAMIVIWNYFIYKHFIYK